MRRTHYYLNLTPVDSPSLVPTITSFSPTSGPVGTTLIINGTNFTGATVVSVNSGAVASFTVDSPTHITAVLNNAQASGLVRVTTPNGTAVSSSPFTVTVPAVPTEYTLQGADFWSNALNLTQGTDVIRNPWSFVRFQLPAGQTSFEVYAKSDTGAFEYSQVGVIANNVVRPAVNVDFNVPGYAWYTSSGHPAGATIDLITGYLGKGNPDYQQGGYLKKIRVTGTTSLQAPTAPSKTVTIFGTSIDTGPSIALVNAYCNLLRRDSAIIAAGYRLRNETVSGGALYDVYNDPSVRAAFITRMGAGRTGTVSNTLYSAHGTNDLGVWNLSAAAFITLYSAFLDDYHAAYPADRIIVQQILPRGIYGYSTEQAFADARSGIIDMVAARPWIELVTLDIQLADLGSDQVHPTIATHLNKLYPQIKAVILGSVSQILYPAEWINASKVAISGGTVTRNDGQSGTGAGAYCKYAIAAGASGNNEFRWKSNTTAIGYNAGLGVQTNLAYAPEEIIYGFTVDTNTISLSGSAYTGSLQFTHGSTERSLMLRRNGNTIYWVIDGTVVASQAIGAIDGLFDLFPIALMSTSVAQLKEAEFFTTQKVEAYYHDPAGTLRIQENDPLVTLEGYQPQTVPGAGGDANAYASADGSLSRTTVQAGMSKVQFIGYCGPSGGTSTIKRNGNIIGSGSWYAVSGLLRRPQTRVFTGLVPGDVIEFVKTGGANGFVDEMKQMP
jgi:hypothetical protein